jgi:hypothetical protein
VEERERKCPFFSHLEHENRRKTNAMHGAGLAIIIIEIEL